MNEQSLELEPFTIQPEEQKTLDGFLASLDRKQRTKESYRKALKPFFEYLHLRAIQGPTRTDIIAYKLDLFNRGYKPATIASYLTAVKAFFIYLEATNLYTDITKGIEGPKLSKDHQSKEALTIGQVKTVLSQVDRSTNKGKRDFALINLLLRTGLRTIEAERANLEDITKKNGQTVLYVQGKGKDAKDAFVVLTEETHRPIREYLDTRINTNLKSPLFASISDRNNGQRLSTRSMSRIVKNAFRKAYLDQPELTAHSLRHTAVTMSLLAGATIQETQKFARHADINTTLRYAHNLDRIGQAPELKIDALLAGAL